MIINIRKSSLFTTDPDFRFSREYGVPRGVWTELWLRYKLHDFNLKDLCLLYELRTRKIAHPKSIQRWIWRSEVYSLVLPALKKGAVCVNSAYFREYEMEVIKELTKNIKTSVRQNVRSIP